MKILIIGGVAAGTKVAAKLKREDQSAEVTIVTKGKDISYAGCGLPYYVGDLIHEKEQLIVNTPNDFSKLTGVEVRTEIEVTAIDRNHKTITAMDRNMGECVIYHYDKLVIATGASPIRPDIEGISLKNVFFLRTPEDAIALREAVESGMIKRAVVAGGGFIGLEVAENLKQKNIKVSVIDMADHIMPGFDKEMASYVENHLFDQGIGILTNTKLESILGVEAVEKVQTNRRAIKADALIISVGIRPNTEFLKDSGVECMPNKTIKVNEFLQTNDKDIYAVGDCAMVTNRITEKPMWSPMGSSANIEGRIAALHLVGKHHMYLGALGTAIVKLPELNAGRTGLTETEAKEAGCCPMSVIGVVGDKAHYYPDASSFLIKMIADKETKRFLGIQCLGKGAVDKIIDIAVMALSMKASLMDMEDLDFAYAPPFSTAIHPIVHMTNILLNKISGEFETVTPVEFQEGAAEEYKVLDVSRTKTIPEAEFIDLTSVNGEFSNYKKEDKLLLVCTKGRRAYLLQNRLKYYGYTNTKVLEGGTAFNGVELQEEL